MKAPFMRQIRLPDLKKYPNEAKVKKSIRLAVEYINLLWLTLNYLVCYLTDSLQDTIGL